MESNRILVICKGNVCRSAFAAAWMREFAKRSGLTDVQIESAGTEGKHNGDRAHPTAIAVAREFDIDLSGHVAHQVTAKDILSSHLILVMDFQNIRRLKELFPQETKGKRIKLLGEELGESLEIPDPDKMPISAFRECMNMITAASQSFFQHR